MSNLNFNRAIIAGRLTADPEVKHTQSGVPVCSFTVAVNRKYKDKASNEPQTDFLNVVAWRQQAELVGQYFRKGSSICLVGQIQTRSWQDSSGQKRYATEIMVDELYFVDSRSDAATAPPAAEAQTNAPYIPDAYMPSAAQNLPASPGYDDLPF